MHLITNSSTAATVGLKLLGMEAYEQEILHRYLEKVTSNGQESPRGLILFAAPTKQGKTVSLHNTVALLREQEIEIASIENPIEMDIPGFQQMAVQDAPGYRFSDRMLHGAFSAGLDALMIGEVTSSEEAEAALNFATNAGTVCSSIRAADANHGFAKLTDLVSAQPINTPVLVVAQSLYRRLCFHCRAPYLPTAEEHSLIATWCNDVDGLTEKKWSNATGCAKCNDGFSGRGAAFEVLEHNQQEHILRRTLNENLIRKAASGSMAFSELTEVLGSKVP